MAAPLVSIVVDNHNYAGFLPRSVGGALAPDLPERRTWWWTTPQTDDGSQEIIQAFGQRVTSVLKAVDVGHGAAVNSWLHLGAIKVSRAGVLRTATKLGTRNPT